MILSELFRVLVILYSQFVVQRQQKFFFLNSDYLFALRFWVTIKMSTTFSNFGQHTWYNG